MKKVLFVATVVNTHINVFHIPYLKMLKEMGYETHVAARNDYENPEDCVIPYCDYFHDMPFERNPFKKENIKTYKMLKKLMLEENFDIIHCHTPMGGVLPRLVYKNLKNKINTKIIYTAHGFHFYKGAPLLNWLVYYPVEKYFSKYTDVLITINKEDYNLAKNKFKKCKNIEYVPGVGVDLKNEKNELGEIQRIKKNLNVVEDRKFIILSVGELIPRKNQMVLLKALKKLDDKDIYCFICGRGNLKNTLQEFIDKNNMNENIKLLGFRKDIDLLLDMADCFIFPSLQEGLPVALMEAMSRGKLIICSNIRGNEDLITHNVTGYMFEPNNIDQLCELIKKVKYQNKKNQIMKEKVKSSIKTYLIENIKPIMKNIYKEVLK